MTDGDGGYARTYRDQVEAVRRQQLEFHRETDLIAQWTPRAAGFRFDPRRPPEPNLRVVASFVRPRDTVLEVGGGAGRVGLPLALRCHRLINVEPSEAMGDQFRASAREAGIENVDVVPQAWETAPDLHADVVLAADVTYFIADIVPFIEKLQRSAGRLVMIWIWAVPPPNRHASLFELVHGKPLAPVPGHRQLLPVLWEMGILPDVLMLPEPFRWPETLPTSPEGAVRFALAQIRAESSAAARRVASGVNVLFKREGDLYVPLWRPPSPGMLITWKPAGGGTSSAGSAPAR